MPPSNTPAEPCGACVTRFPQNSGLPCFLVRSASAMMFRGLLGVHCTLRPACSLNPQGTLLWKCFSRSRCLLPPLPVLPAGATGAGWDFHPLKIAAFHGTRERAKKPASLRSDQGWRNQSEHPGDLDRNGVADSFGIEWRNQRNTHISKISKIPLDIQKFRGRKYNP